MLRFNSKKHEMTSNESREQAEASSNVATDTDERIDQLSEERTVIMDIPIVVTPEKPTLTIFDHAPAYSPTPKRSKEILLIIPCIPFQVIPVLI